MVADLLLVEALIERIKPELGGQPAEVQGAVLADLLAIWLAGHVVSGDKEATAKIRNRLLRDHIAAVRELVRVNAKILGTDQ